MKKLLLFLAVSLCVFTARAGDYAYLVFTNTSGTNTVLSVADLSLQVNGNALQVTNSSESLGFVLTELASMEFSKDGIASAFDNVLNADEPVQVFTPLGTSLGTFESLREAAENLDKGVYVISNGTNAQTIILR